MVDINDYNEERECTYKGEKYLVRDNGAISRSMQEGKPKRRLDGVWTFGNPNEKTGYMDFAGQRVHRIVAYAFLGNPPTEQHVVDHKDTNRRNNRPENLRWVTRLENALNNPITRAKIEMICGIEAFLNNPSILQGYEAIDTNFSWMQTVSPEEARNSLSRLTAWAKNPTPPKGGVMGDWVFKERKNNRSSATWNNEPLLPKMKEDTKKTTSKKELLRTQSLTPNAVQLDWKYPVAFPCCPQQFSGNPLEAYMANLKVDKIFSKNDMGESTVLDFGMPQPDCLWVMSSIRIGWKTHAFTKITYEDGIFYHQNKGVYDIGDEPEEFFDKILNGDLIAVD